MKIVKLVKLKLLVPLAICFTLFSCAAVVVPQVSGGNRSAGVVELSYSYGGLQWPEPDWPQAQVNAVRACRNWGYSGATPFSGPGNRSCDYQGADGRCNTIRETFRYQCTGQLNR